MVARSDEAGDGGRSAWFEEAPVALSEISPNGSILRANAAAAALLGYPPERYAGARLAEFHTDAGVAETLLAQLGRGEPVRDLAASMRAADGTVRHVLIDANPLSGAGGRFAGARCFTRDVTELRKSDLRAQAAQAELERRVAERTAELTVTLARLQKLASTDVLTGLANRRALDEHLARIHAEHTRHAAIYSALMIDLDGFKHVNDGHGHRAGDQVLRVVARALAARARASDVIGRWGGDEFLVLAPRTNAGAAEAFAESLRDAVRTAAARRPDGRHLEACVGWAAWDGEEPAERVIARADMALLGAKSAAAR